jgi:cell division septation protein DedD
VIAVVAVVPDALLLLLEVLGVLVLVALLVIWTCAHLTNRAIHGRDHDVRRHNPRAPERKRRQRSVDLCKARSKVVGG